MKKHLKTIIIILLLLLLGIGLYIAVSYSNRVKFNDDYVNGNTAGNLYNGGYFCEYEGTIYFANPDDENKLYSMDSNGKNIQKISNDMVGFLNVDENYIYYVRNNPRASVSFDNFSFFQNALCRLSKGGKNVEVLDEDPCNYASLCGNYIYYLHYDEQTASTLYKVKIDGTERQQILNSAIYTCSANGQYIYYNGMTTDGSLYCLDTATDHKSLVYECNSFKPIVNSRSDVYYLDVDQDNALVHVDIDAGKPVTLTDDSIDLYNVYGDTIYYQNYKDNNESALCSIKSNGTSQTLIQKGYFKNIHVTSQFVFFTDYYSDIVYYFSRSNPNDIREFHPGVDEN